MRRRERSYLHTYIVRISFAPVSSPLFFRRSIPSRLFLSWFVSQEHVPAAGIKADAPVVGLVLQKSHINTKDECHYVALVAELEARGAKVRKE